MLTVGREAVGRVVVYVLRVAEVVCSVVVSVVVVVVSVVVVVVVV